MITYIQHKIFLITLHSWRSNNNPGIYVCIILLLTNKTTMNSKEILQCISLKYEKNNINLGIVHLFYFICTQNALTLHVLHLFVLLIHVVLNKQERVFYPNIPQLLSELTLNIHKNFLHHRRCSSVASGWPSWTK